jgi:hypothetical protein
VKQDQTDARRIAGYLGPWLLVNGAAEILNLDVWSAQTAPVIYLNGSLLLAAGLIILRGYSSWHLGWPLLVTFTGWIFLLGGLGRMLAPAVQMAGASDATTIATASLTGAIGVVLTYQAYLRREVS